MTDTQPPDRQVPCPKNPRAWFTSTNAPWGRVTAYCRWCRKVHTVMLGKAPETINPHRPVSLAA